MAARTDRMDVTSLLNSSAAKMEERRESVDLTPTPSVVSNTTAASTGVATPPAEKTPPRCSSESRTPNRSRTPWDAGGYSLPLTLDTKMSRTPSTAAKPVFYSESPTDPIESASPSSPKHKFSDSRSSLSSSYTTASSNNSGSHSRISSLSTVSEFQPLTNLITEFNSLEAKMPNEQARSISMNNNSSTSDHSDTTVKRLDSGISRDGGLNGMGNGNGADVASDVTGLVPGGHVNPLNSLDIMAPVASMSDEGAEASGSRSGRAQSPSDAVLITSGAARPPEMGRPNERYYAHKRAISAPDFPAVRSRFQPSLGFTPILEPTLGSSSFYGETGAKMAPQEHEENFDDAHGDSDAEGQEEELHGEEESASGTGAADRLPPPPAAAAIYNPDEESHCMYKNDCDTGSALRKAISHIFGRNKLCTRQIPQRVWVYYCRKHYQRSRYRSGPGYSHVQIDLVLTQIARIEQWSESNRARDQPGVVTSWNLRLRKREMDKPKPVQPPRTDPRIVAGTHMPSWLRELVRDGYTTEEIRDIVRRIKASLDAGEITQIPDIEILPNITSDRGDEPGTKPSSTKKPAKRGPSTSIDDEFKRLDRQGGPTPKRARNIEQSRSGAGHQATASMPTNTLPYRTGSFYPAPPAYDYGYPTPQSMTYQQSGRGGPGLTGYSHHPQANTGRGPAPGMFGAYSNGNEFGSLGGNTTHHFGAGGYSQVFAPQGPAFGHPGNTYSQDPVYGGGSSYLGTTQQGMDPSFPSYPAPPQTGNNYRYQGHSRNASTPVASTTAPTRRGAISSGMSGGMGFPQSQYPAPGPGTGTGPGSMGFQDDSQRRRSIATPQSQSYQYPQPSRYGQALGASPSTGTMPPSSMSGNGYQSGSTATLGARDPIEEAQDDSRLSHHMRSTSAAGLPPSNGWTSRR